MNQGDKRAKYLNQSVGENRLGVFAFLAVVESKFFSFVLCLDFLLSYRIDK